MGLTTEWFDPKLATDDNEKKFNGDNNNNNNAVGIMEDGSILALYVSRLGVVSTTVAHGFTTMFVGGLPYHLKDR